MKFKEYLESRNACQGAIDWVSDKTLAEAWQACERPDWMLWLYERNNPDKTICVKIAVFAAQLALPIWQKKYPGDLRPQQAIEAAKKWIENPSEKNWVEACVARAAAAEAAADAGAWAAWAAADAADAARAAADAAGEAGINKTIADYIRQLIPTIEIVGE